MRVLICGGGVIGAAIAYFLSRRGAEAVVVERTGIACAASGKSGGFLARDWCDGTPLEALARRSFALHAELADRIGGAPSSQAPSSQAPSSQDWGYRRMTTYSAAASARRRLGAHRPAQHLAWLADDVIVGQRLGSAETTAQVHPGQFTTVLMQAAQAQGAQLRHGLVTDIAKAADIVTGVIVDGETLRGDAVVIAMGPWSILAAQWLPLPAVFGLKGHSLVFDTGTDVPAEALFAEFEEQNGAVSAPEIFPRRDGTTYVCAISSETPLPLDPAQVEADPGAFERLETMCRHLSPTLANAPIRARQACYRPVTRDGLPLIGVLPGLANAYVATGHSVWGILNAPATGEALAELILDGAARTIDLAPFDPARLPPSDARRRRV